MSLAIHFLITLVAPAVIASADWGRSIAAALTRPQIFRRAVSPLFPLAVLTRLAALLVAAALLPVLSLTAPPAAFPLDFIALAGLLGISRAALALALRDAGAKSRGSARAFRAAAPSVAIVAVFGLLAFESGESELCQLVAATPAADLFTNLLLREGAAVVLLLTAWLCQIGSLAELCEQTGPEAAFLSLSGALDVGIFAILSARLANPAELAWGATADTAITLILLVFFCRLFASRKLEPVR